ncbi:MAG: sensor domain-containing diguanylate cyclase [Thermomonas sp.]
MPVVDNSDVLEFETARQAALDALRITDSLPEPAYDAVVKLASILCGTPISLISLITGDRQWFKARIGLEAEETPRSMAFCNHAIASPGEVMEVRDASIDPRFHNNPLVTGEPNIRFYAGHPLVDSQGHALGTVCVIDRVPRQFDDTQRAGLAALADVVSGLLDARRSSLLAERALADREFAYRCLERYRSHLEQQLAQDNLTGLLTRAETDRRSREYAESGLSAPFALAVVDVDHFKRVNDNHGHAAGDLALKQVGQVINSHVSADDIAGRYGGEEFLIVLGHGSREQMRDTLERVRAAVEALPLPFPLTVSIGVAFGSRGQDTVDDMFNRADAALYRAKNGGRNRIELAARLD